MTTDKQIWVFKESKAGSLWFCNTLEKKLQRTSFHYEEEICNFAYEKAHGEKAKLPFSPEDPESLDFPKYINDLKDPSFFYSTHRFNLLKFSNLLEDDTILIRLTRRDHAEHVLSKLAHDMFPRANRRVFVDRVNQIGSEPDPKSFYGSPEMVTKQQVKRKFQHLKQVDEFWNTFAKNYENAVVVYEDLESGVSIEPLGISIKFSDNVSFIKKNPDYKKDAFINYDHVIKWCREYEKEFELTQY